MAEKEALIPGDDTGFSPFHPSQQRGWFLRLTFIEAGIDFGNLRHPLLSLRVLQHQDLLVRPMKMKCDIRYLLIEPL